MKKYKKMKSKTIGIIALTIVFTLTCTQTHSQNSDLGNWLIYIGNKKINSKWNLHNELQYRNYNAIGDLEQLLIRTGLGYSFKETNSNLLLGYGYIKSENFVNETERKSFG